MSRLETVDHDLARRLAAAEPSALRQAAAALAEYAIVETGLHDAVVDAALRRLRSEANNQPEPVEIARLIEQLDERQWELQDRAEVGDASPQEHLSAFSRARAAAALNAAFDPDPVAAAQDAAYEALAAVDDLDAIRRIVGEHLAR